MNEPIEKLPVDKILPRSAAIEYRDTEESHPSCPTCHLPLEFDTGGREEPPIPAGWYCPRCK